MPTVLSSDSCLSLIEILITAAGFKLLSEFDSIYSLATRMVSKECSVLMADVYF